MIWLVYFKSSWAANSSMFHHDFDRRFFGVSLQNVVVSGAANFEKDICYSNTLTLFVYWFAVNRKFVPTIVLYSIWETDSDGGFGSYQKLKIE